MHFCVRVCMYRYVCTGMYGCVCTVMYVPVCIYRYVCTGMYVRVCMYWYVYSGMYVSVCFVIGFSNRYNQSTAPSEDEEAVHGGQVTRTHLAAGRTGVWRLNNTPASIHVYVY